MNTVINDIRLSAHITVSEFCNLDKYPENIPNVLQIANMIYGCRQLLEPAREAIGCPIIVNSGFRNADVNRRVGGVRGSQHQQGCAADIRPKDPQQFQPLVEFLKTHALADQLLTGPDWLHISWSPFRPPRHIVRIGYYK